MPRSFHKTLLPIFMYHICMHNFLGFVASISFAPHKGDAAAWNDTVSIHVGPRRSIVSSRMICCDLLHVSFAQDELEEIPVKKKKSFESGKLSGDRRRGTSS